MVSAGGDVNRNVKMNNYFRNGSTNFSLPPFFILNFSKSSYVQMCFLQRYARPAYRRTFQNLIQSSQRRGKTNGRGLLIFMASGNFVLNLGPFVSFVQQNHALAGWPPGPFTPRGMHLAPRLFVCRARPNRCTTPRFSPFWQLPQSSASWPAPASY